jgi:hypothetical protein
VVEREYLLEGVPAHDQDIYGSDERSIAAIFVLGYRGVGFIEPIDASVGSGDEAVEARGDVD